LRPVTERWARLGPRDRHTLVHTPEAGLCLSAFVISRRRNSILLFRPHAHDAWETKGAFPKRGAAELAKEGAWLLPATHLLMEESPDHAARRIVREWAGLKGTPRLLMVQSHTRPGGFLGKRLSGNHWDICFVYELTTGNEPRAKPWWSEARYVPIPRISRMKLGRGHLDILREAGIIRKRR
jgi:ADP-ribose pyrophosphatase YjhB (NUDIX family)